MRLYLSSFRLGRHQDRLTALTGAGRRAAVICNAMDAATSDIRRQAVERECGSLAGLGFEPTEFDLRETSLSDAADFDLVWVRGGNVFLLRRLLADTGSDTVLLDLLDRDAFVYAGYSAGACVLGTDLSELASVDDLSVVNRPLFTGLGVLDRPVVPHVDSPDHPETAACTGVAEVLRGRGVRHWALRDGEVLLVHGEHLELLG
ncbi:MAG TPA: Type 1 glutamine amidotransferase-like domain-containing protein [Jatrophihabitans sp.]|nr:Type 1 glutamine amidotransferase-like domain-containing protein [Jatrophihabitans sp.]